MQDQIAVLPQYVLASVAEDETGGKVPPTLLRAITVALENDKTAVLMDIDPHGGAASKDSLCHAFELAKSNGAPAGFKVALVIHSFEHLHAYRTVEELARYGGLVLRLFSFAEDAKNWLVSNDETVRVVRGPMRAFYSKGTPESEQRMRSVIDHVIDGIITYLSAPVSAWQKASDSLTSERDSSAHAYR